MSCSNLIWNWPWLKCCALSSRGNISVSFWGFPCKFIERKSFEQEAQINFETAWRNMLHCSAFDCNNQSRNNKKIHFMLSHQTKILRRFGFKKLAVMSATYRKKKTYFSVPVIFQRNVLTKATIWGWNTPPTKKKLSRMLLPGSIPTIFSHKPAPNPKRTLTSQNLWE